MLRNSVLEKLLKGRHSRDENEERRKSRQISIPIRQFKNFTLTPVRSLKPLKRSIVEDNAKENANTNTMNTNTMNTNTMNTNTMNTTNIINKNIFRTARERYEVLEKKMEKDKHYLQSEEYLKDDTYLFVSGGTSTRSIPIAKQHDAYMRKLTLKHNQNHLHNRHTALLNKEDISLPKLKADTRSCLGAENANTVCEGDKHQYQHYAHDLRSSSHINKDPLRGFNRALPHHVSSPSLRLIPRSLPALKAFSGETNLDLSLNASQIFPVGIRKSKLNSIIIS